MSKRAVLHVAGDLIPGLIFVAIVLLCLSVPDLMVQAIKIVVR